jgi:methionyl-tRNA synthetase
MSLPRYTVTAALPYANGPLHLGHVAGVYLPADIFVRFLRLKGHDVAFICGSDEHGAAITLRAKKEGISPQEIVDKYHHILADSFKNFSINFDIFHRTSAEIHKETAQAFFLKLNAEGKFTKQQSEQFYDEEFNQFLADRYVTGECPHCHNPNAYGDQCEKCGTSLSPSDLINPKSTLSGKPPVMRDTSHWYLPMERHESWLKPWIKTGVLDGQQHHDASVWRNQVVGQCMSWIDGGLKPRAMTRDLDWGVPVPVEGADGKVLYVWLDAPIGYISATKQWALDNGKNWEDYWKTEGVAKPSKLVHFIGKDNIVFHTIIFPIILKEFGGLVLPDNVPASEFLNLEGDKFSTSRNWAVWLHEYLASYPEKIDELKYTLTAIAPESKDSEFTWDEYQTRVNNELVAILGNFVNRALVLTNKYYEGMVPPAGAFTPEDEEVLKAIKSFPSKIEQLLYAYKIREAQSEMMNLARLGNKYLADHEPWKLQKTDPKRVETIMYIAVQITGALSILMEPFLPNSASKIRVFVGLHTCSWDALQHDTIVAPGTQLKQPEILFQKIEDRLVKTEQEKLFATKKEASMEAASDLAPAKSEITFDDFVGMDIRVGEILTAQKVEKADKLLQLTVNVGLDTRTIVSGIAEHYTPEEVIGQNVLVLVNLAPRKIRGVESKGMILMAENPEGKLSFVAPSQEMAIGSVVR